MTRVCALMAWILIGAVLLFLLSGCAPNREFRAVTGDLEIGCAENFEHRLGTLVRWVDLEAGIVCYRFAYTEGIDCVPLSSCEDEFQQRPCPDIPRGK